MAPRASAIKEQGFSEAVAARIEAPQRRSTSWASVEVRYILGRTETLDTNLTDQSCPCTHHPAFFPRISLPKRVQRVCPKWLYQPWPQPWIGPSSLTGPSVRSERCATIWTGPQAE